MQDTSVLIDEKKKKLNNSIAAGYDNRKEFRP
jgi:hypothetical protein